GGRGWRRADSPWWRRRDGPGSRSWMLRQPVQLVVEAADVLARGEPCPVRMVRPHARGEPGVLLQESCGIAIPGRIELSGARMDRGELGRHREAQSRAVRAIREVEVVEVEAVEGRGVEPDAARGVAIRGDEKAVERLH